jgi:hypothetical protein|tara:strand:- start:7988 stop:8578 length:591 start_codon:yes stop_codon:yes gene_type:complete
MIIAFAGRKQSGKTTSAEFVKNIFENRGLGVGTIYNFADPLKKDVCMNVFGLTYHQCYGSDESKNELVDCYWPDTDQQMTAREVMQYVGTDVFRKIQHNVWASATINKINLEKPNLAIIADCRFPNEVEAIKNNNGIVIKLNRNPYNSTHASEESLDANNYSPENFDLVIDNGELSIGKQNEIIHDFLIDKGILPL